MAAPNVLPMNAGAERGHVIPNWYKPHPDLSVPVTQGGEPLGFTVGQVLDYRRWAVQHDGELMDQRSFEDRYKQYIAYQMIGLKDADPSKEAVPRVERWVNRTLDDMGKGRPIAVEGAPWNPLARPAKPIEAKYNQEGNLSEHYLREQRDRDVKLAELRAYQKLYQSGKLTAEEFAELTGGDAAAEQEEKPEPKTSTDQETSPPQWKTYGQTVRISESEHVVDDKTPMVETELAPCGFAARKGFLIQHAQKCQTHPCQEYTQRYKEAKAAGKSAKEAAEVARGG